MCAARLAKGDLILADVPISEGGTPPNVRERLAEWGRRRRLSVDTVDQYRRVAAWYHPQRREAIEKSGVIASYSLLREVALHTHGTATDGEVRFTTLLAALRGATDNGKRHITRRDYLHHLGVNPQPASDGRFEAGRVLAQIAEDTQVRATVIEAVRADPAVVESVLRAVAEDPEGPAQFFSTLAEEGGLEALETASFSLRKARTDAKAREVEVFGKDPEPSPLEVILRAVVRAMKALEAPLDLDPSQIVEALPPEQFAALNRLCGSVSQWHELLLAAARTAENNKTEVVA